MTWFREHRLWCGRLAIFATLLQLGLSFGHIASSAHAHIAPAHGVAAPADHDEGGEPGSQQHCAICAVIHLAGTLTLPEPAELPVPELIVATWTQSFTHAAASRVPAPFNARAPPQA